MAPPAGAAGSPDRALRLRICPSSGAPESNDLLLLFDWSRAALLGASLDRGADRAATSWPAELRMTEHRQYATCKQQHRHGGPCCSMWSGSQTGWSTPAPPQKNATSTPLIVAVEVDFQAPLPGPCKSPSTSFKTPTCDTSQKASWTWLLPFPPPLKPLPLKQPPLRLFHVPTCDTSQKPSRKGEIWRRKM
jgi:hypothetical protein